MAGIALGLPPHPAAAAASLPACLATPLQVLRREGSQPSVCMVLLSFATQEQADNFYTDFNTLPFSSLEPDILCRCDSSARAQRPRLEHNGRAWLLRIGCQVPLCPASHTLCEPPQQQRQLWQQQQQQETRRVMHCAPARLVVSRPPAAATPPVQAGVCAQCGGPVNTRQAHASQPASISKGPHGSSSSNRHTHSS